MEQQPYDGWREDIILGIFIIFGILVISYIFSTLN
jgi:hypothetical protein